MIGPVAMPTPVVAPHSPIAAARSRWPVKTLVSSDNVAGNIIAAPSPITARAPISAGAETANEPARLAAPKTPRPASSIPLRPSRSDVLPATSTRAAKTRL